MLTQRGLQGRFIGWGAIAVLATYALFVGGAWAPTYSVFFRVITLVLAAGGIVIWLLIASRDPFWRPRTALAPAFAAAFVVFVISTLTSRYPRFGAEYLAWSILLAALYLLLQRLMASDFFRVRMVGFATAAALAIGVWYMAVIVLDWIAFWQIVGHVTPPPLRPRFESLVFGNPSAVLTASVLLAAPAVASLWGVTRGRSGFAIVLSLLSVFAIIASGSRAGWLAVAVAVTVVGGLWLASPDRRRAITIAARSRAARVAAIVGLLPLVVTALTIGPGLAFRAGAGDESVRLAFYRASLRMWESSPLVGTGPGTWAPLRISSTVTGESDYYIPHAHSIYLQTLAEFGLLGVAAGLIVVLYLGRLLAGALRDPDPGTRRMGWAALFATVYFAAHQALDFYQNAPAILFAYAIPIAWLDAARPSRDAAQRDAPQHIASGRIRAAARRPVAIGGLVALVGAVAFLGWSERAAYRMDDGLILVNDRNLPAAVAPLEAAVALDPEMPPYHFALGLALASTGDLDGAEREFLASAGMDDLPEAWLNLAAIQVRLGKAAAAGVALERALRLGNQQAAVNLGAGALSLELGDHDSAVANFAKAMLSIPSLAGDPWWQAESARARAWTDAYGTALAAGPPVIRFELALQTGDLDLARQAVKEMEDAETRATSDLVLAAWVGEPGAFTRLEDRARERPFDIALVNWCARLLRRSGDDAAAEPYATWAETINGLSSIGGHQARVVNHDGAFQVVGVNSLFYGHFTYRRPTPSNQFVQGLPLIELE